ncbi:uncharacterized protein [Triticum aestivum]|uniref:uncharacterized protein isoform X8 n=1 Tax=Triticum aestivum TaxID=4565 RepID=UPI001D01CBB9|nr:uncharacterized protein LOC123070484 isoform X8 [Triticum aestivum]
MGWVGAPDPAPSSFFLTGSPPYYLPIDATFISPAARRPTRHRPAPVAQRPPRHRPAPAARPLHLARSTHSQDTRRGHAVQMQRGCRRPPVEKRFYRCRKSLCESVRAPVVQVGRMEDFVNLNRYIFHGMSFHFFI